MSDARMRCGSFDGVGVHPKNWDGHTEHLRFPLILRFLCHLLCFWLPAFAGLGRSGRWLVLFTAYPFDVQALGSGNRARPARVVFRGHLVRIAE